MKGNRCGTRSIPQRCATLQKIDLLVAGQVSRDVACWFPMPLCLGRGKLEANAPIPQQHHVALHLRIGAPSCRHVVSTMVFEDGQVRMRVGWVCRMFGNRNATNTVGIIQVSVCNPHHAVRHVDAPTPETAALLPKMLPMHFPNTYCPNSPYQLQALLFRNPLLNRNTIVSHHT